MEIQMADAEPQKKTLLSTLKEVTFFVAIYLYFMGFVYISTFYDTFGIPLRSLDTPVYDFFIYSYNVMTGVLDIAKQKPTRTSIVAIIVLAAILVVARWRPRSGAILYASLVILFPVVFYVARITARADALRVRTQETAKAITFIFKKDASARSSVRLLKTFTTGKDDTATSTEDRRPENAKQPQASPSKEQQATNNDKIENIEDNAELQALRRFFDANRRIDLDEQFDQEANVTTLWPKLYLVTETPTSFYVFLQPFFETGSLPYGYVYEIAKADVLVSEIKIPD
jgi:hypothetical protein